LDDLPEALSEDRLGRTHQKDPGRLTWNWNPDRYRQLCVTVAAEETD
jgi:hypothetical protein